MLQENARKEIKRIVDLYKGEKTPLMLILPEIQHQFGYIPLEVQEYLSDLTGISVAEIYGIVDFCSIFTMEPKGKYIINVCIGTPCHVNGSAEIIKRFGDLLGIKVGETSKDGLFTMDALRCIGACGIGPVVSINGKIYPQVKLAQIPNIIEEYKGIQE